MDAALDVIPELRVCVIAVRQARAFKLQYPIESHQTLCKLLNGKKTYACEGHRITAEHIARYFTKEDFPIADEKELIIRSFAALNRCNADYRWAAQAPPNARALLRDFSKLVEQGGQNG